MEIRYPIAAQVKFDIGLDPHVPKTQNVYFHKLRHAAREDSPKIFYFSPDCKMTADPSFSSLQDLFWASAREVHLSFEVDLFPGTTCPALDLGPCIGHVCQQKEARRKQQVCFAIVSKGAASTPGRLDQWPGRQVHYHSQSLSRYASQRRQPCARIE